MNGKTPNTSKDFWDKLDIIVRLLASIAIPVVIALVGNAYNTSIKESENRVRYVELAVASLQTSPTPDTAALRSWAVELLDAMAPVKIPAVAKEQLMSKALPRVFSITGSGGAVAGGTGTVTVGKASERNND